MRKPCGCYVDESGRVFAKCAGCNGSAVRSAQELKLHLSTKREADNAKRRALRAQYINAQREPLRDGKVRNHKQSEGGP